MRCPSKEFLRISVLLCGIALAVNAQAPTPPAQAPTKTVRAVQNFVTVTDQTLRAPSPQDWPIHRGNYQAWGYSPLDQINKANVKNLQLVWSRAMEPGINEATPLVYNGVMYLGNPGDVIQAIDAATGDLLWEYRHPRPPASSMRNALGQRKRSIAIYGDQIYFVSWDNVVVSLGARSGEVVWQANRGGDLEVSNSTGPIVANGVVIAGTTCQISSHGCYVTGHDARTGRELWRNEMIPRPGEPGDETCAGAPSELRCMTRRIPVAEGGQRAGHRRRYRSEGSRHRERKRGAQGRQQDLSRVPNLQRRTRLAARRLQSEAQRQVYTAFESLQ